MRDPYRVLGVSKSAYGDIKRFESYDTRPNPINPKITI